MINLINNDDDLDQSPLGDFLLSVANKLSTLDFPGLQNIEISKVFDKDKSYVSSLILIPLPEVPEEKAAGELQMTYRISAMFVESHSQQKKKRNMGRHLAWRNTLLVNFSKGSNGKLTTEQDRCFNTAVIPSVLFPKFASKWGVDISLMGIQGKFRLR